MRFIDANYIEYTPRKWLTFDDVLLLPNRSDVPSRNSEKLDLSSHFTSGIGMRLPIISANMDTITEGRMAIAMGKAGGQGILHRFYKSKTEWLKDILAVEEAGLLPAFSIGVSKDDVRLVEEVLNRLKQPKCVVTVDVAHGHHQLVFDQVRRLALGFANNINVIAGNVCTPEGAAYLVSAGANGVKVGVGGGCFLPGTKITTLNGLKNIEDITTDDTVLTHTGSYEKVTATTSRLEEKEILEINDIKCTSNHEFYVVDKTDLDKISDENIHSFAKWIRADELNENYFLVQVENLGIIKYELEPGSHK